MTKKLCLKWDDFQDNTRGVIAGLRHDVDYTDVTLACEDGQQVEAHKVILASSSPFFQNLLRKNKHPHPLIYMRGVKSEDLVALVDFLYYGEANIYQENIDAFFAIAEELNMKGLTGNLIDEHIRETKTKKQMLTPKKTHQSENMHPFGNYFQSSDNLAEAENLEECFSKPSKDPAPEQEEPMTDLPETKNKAQEIKVEPKRKSRMPAVPAHFQGLDQQVRSLMAKSQNVRKDGKSLADVCTVCGKEGYSTEIKDHIERHHLEGVSIPCDFCGKTFRSRWGMTQHRQKNCSSFNSKKLQDKERSQEACW